MDPSDSRSTSRTLAWDSPNSGATSSDLHGYRSTAAIMAFTCYVFLSYPDAVPSNETHYADTGLNGHLRGFRNRRRDIGLRDFTSTFDSW